MTTTAPTVAEQAAAAQAEANRLRAAADRIDAAGRQARDAAMLKHYSDTERATQYRQRRDSLKAAADQLAEVDDSPDTNTLFAAWREMRDAHAKAGALSRTREARLRTQSSPLSNRLCDHLRSSSRPIGV